MQAIVENSEDDKLVANLRKRLHKIAKSLPFEKRAQITGIIQRDLPDINIKLQLLAMEANVARNQNSGSIFLTRVSEEKTSHPEAADYVLRNYSCFGGRSGNPLEFLHKQSILKVPPRPNRGLGAISETVYENTTCDDDTSSEEDLINMPASVSTEVTEVKPDVQKRPMILDDATFKFASCWEFDVLAFSEKPEIGGMPLLVLGHFIIIQSGLKEDLKLDMDRVDNWLRSVEMEYNDLPYHNHLHGADVMCSMYYWWTSELFKESMSSLDLLASIMAAAAHDVDHDGVTNEFHTNVWSELAQQFNNVSPLENHHANLSTKLLSMDECNWLKSLKIVDRYYVRTLMLKLVLATESRQHQEHLENIQQVVLRGLSQRGGTVKKLLAEDSKQKQEKMLILEAGIHIADLANPANPTQISIK